MNNNQIYNNDHETLAPNISLTSRVDVGPTMVSINSQGSLVPPCSGTIELSASGTLLAQGGNATVQLSTDPTQCSSVLIDGGPMGSVTIANALPIGTAQSVKLDSMTSAIEISNGNVPGATQSISLDGLTQSIELNAGGLPVSPAIQMSPLGIKLSMGPTNYIEIGPEGVTISGLMVAVKGIAQTDVEGALVNIQAEAIAAVKAALVQIQ